MDRKKIIKFLEKEETYNFVLNTIDSECQKNGTHLDAYPQEYFLAGGSVANTIHHLLNKTEKPIINDIDLFYFDHRTDPSWGYLDSTNSFITQIINPVTNVDGYGRVWRGSQGEEIRMTNSQRFGIINKVTISVHLYHKEFNVTDYYEELLNGFDLNCTPVGLDRVNRKIVYTDKFVDFLSSNQIEVIGILHPLQTAVRLYKKIKELNTDSSNFTTEMSLLQHSFLISDLKTIGPEWIEKSKLYRDFISIYFKAHPYQESPEDLFYYTSTPFELKPYVDQFRFSSLNSLIGFWDIFVRNKEPQKLNKIITFYVQQRGLKIEDKKRFWDIENKTIRNCYINNKYMDFFEALSISPNYFNCDFETKDLVEVDNFFKFLQKGYMESNAFIVKNIKQQLDFIKFFEKKFVDSHGLIKMSSLSKVFYRVFNHEERTEISSLEVEVKVQAINKLLNDLWLKPKNRFLVKHKFKQKPFLNLNDFGI